MELTLKKLSSLAVVLLLAVVAASASTQDLAGLPSNPDDLVREVMANELKSDRHPHAMYRLKKVRGNNSEVRQMVETDTLVLGRLLLVNGKPLKRSEAQKEDQRLQRLLQDPNELADKVKDQREEDQRIRRMLRAIPDAFVFQYAGTHSGPEGERVTLKFRPNPDFDPPSRETQVFRGMEGTMEVAVPARRLARIDATLFKDVNFGWGILGHLDKGGHFEVEQAPVFNGIWETTRMVLNFTGKELVFKGLKIQLDQSTSDYQPVPDMTVAQGVELLKKLDVEVARSGGAQR